MWFVNFITTMPFAHPWIFAGGVAAVSAPILIHLLNRSRFRLRPWAAMKFLLESLRKNRRRIQIEELILLLLRCLAVLLLALAVSRFQGCGSMGKIPGGQDVPQAVVFLLDDSYSMGQRHGAGTLFTAATADLAKQIAGLGKADKPYVLLASRVGQKDAVLGGDSLADRVKKLPISDQRGDLARSLAAAGQLLESVEGEKVLYVFSDFREIDLVGDKAAGVRDQFKRLERSGVRVVAMSFAQEAKGNLAIERIELLGKENEAGIAIAGEPIRVAITVRNYGEVEARNVRIELAGRLKSEEAFREMTWPAVVVKAIAPARSRRAETKIRCPQPGSALITAQLPSDELAADNVAHLAMDVRKSVQVLVVDGQHDPGNPRQGESYYLRFALDPNGDGSHGTQLDIASTDRINDVTFSDYDFVVLADVPEFAARLPAIEDYVRRGGGLAIFTGERINFDFYNGPLHRKGAGLNPYRLGTRKGTGSRRGPFVRLAARGLQTQDILRAFSGEASAVTTLIRFFAFTPADTHVVPPREARHAKPPVILARFTDPNESPAVVTRSYGKGSVVWWFTTASARWHDWPSDPVRTYVAVMNDLRNYFTRLQDSNLAARVPEPLVFEMMDKLPANASDLQQRRMTVESGTLKMPRTPNVISLKPTYRFDALTGRIEGLADQLTRGGYAGVDNLRSARAAAAKQFEVRDTAALRQSLTAVAKQLADIEKDAGEQDVSSSLAAGRAMRGRIEELLAGDLAELMQRELCYPPAVEAGVYTLTLRDAGGAKVEEMLYARNIDPAEGDLRIAGDDEVAAALGTEKFRHEKRLLATASESVETKPKKEYWTWAIVAMLIVLALETFLGQRFGHYATLAASRR